MIETMSKNNNNMAPITNPTVTVSQISTSKTIVEVGFKLPRETLEKKLPIIALDESGSMGSNLQFAASGVRKLVKMYLEQKCPEVRVVRYNSKASTTRYTSPSQVETFNPKADGRTNFPAAIKEVVSAIEFANSTKRQARVYFMTDGNNTVDDGMLPHSITQLQSAFQSAIVPPTIDVIGFTSEHDARLLNTFAKMASDGTFQYAATGSALEEIVSDLLEVSSNKTVIGLVLNGNHNSLTAVRDDDDDMFRVVYQTDAYQPDTTREAKLCITGYPALQVPIIKKELDFQTIQRLRLQNIRDVLQQLSSTVDSLSTSDQRAAFDKNLREIDREIDELVGTGDMFRDMSRDQRKLIGQTHSEFKVIVAQLYKARTTRLSTAEYATLLSSASSHITKSGLQKKLAQRVLANMDKDDCSRAKELGRKLSFDTEPNDDDAVCMLTLDNYQEIAKNGDALCISLVVSRSPAAIADPSQVIIGKIQPTFLSLDAFQDAVELKLLGGGDDSSVHGGFEKLLGQSSAVIQGMARENINAVFPVYFDDASWAVTCLRMKESFSWMATITWNGWTFSQTEILPYMILAKALQDYNTNKSEINKRMLDIITATCKKISSTQLQGITLADRQRLMLTKFSDPIDRTIDKVPSIPALIGYAWSVGDDFYYNTDFINNVWEEYFRRELRWSMNDADETSMWRSIASTLHINLDLYTAIDFTRTSSGVEGEKIKALLGLASVGMDRPNVQEGSVASPIEKWTFEKIYSGNIHRAQQTLLTTRGWFGVSDGQVLDDAVFLAATVQNMLHSKNSARREAVTNGTYMSPFVDPVALINSIGERAIKYFYDIKMAQNIVAQNNDIGKAFAQTGDLLQAAGLIKEHVRYIGNSNFSRFARSLNNGGPLFVQKLEMLITGQFKHGGRSVTLMNNYWSPNNSWIYGWWGVSTRDFKAGSLEAKEWNRVFPQYKIGDAKF